MAYSTPATAAGGFLTDAIWNASVRDNILYLKDRLDAPTRTLLYHSTTQSIGNGSDTAIQFDSEITDVGTMHDTVTNNSRITIPSGGDGWYLFTGYAEFASNSTGQRKIYLRRGGTDVLQGWTLDAAAGSNTTRFGVSHQLACVAGAYFELIVGQNSGGALNISSFCYFSARQVTV